MKSFQTLMMIQSYLHLLVAHLDDQKREEFAVMEKLIAKSGYFDAEDVRRQVIQKGHVMSQFNIILIIFNILYLKEEDLIEFEMTFIILYKFI